MQSFRRAWPLVITVFVLQIVLISSSLFPPQAVQSVDWAAKQAAEFPAQLAGVVAQADWIGRGRVMTSRSFWNAKHTAIESEHIVQMYYTIAGESQPALTVRTTGGYLPAEKLGMVDTHTPTFATGEEVLLFLQKADADYQVVGRELGKYTVVDASAVNRMGREPWRLAELYRVIEEELANHGRHSTLPADWVRRESSVKATTQLEAANFVYLNLKWEVNSIKFKLNLNTAQAGGSNGSVQDFYDAIVAGATTWNLVAEADFSILADGTSSVTEPTLNTKNEIMFVKRGASDIAGQGRLWYTENRIIKEADMWLNDDRNWDATGSPAAEEVDLQSVALHELGHWLGLGHDPDHTAIMYSTLTLGMLKRALTSNDQAGIVYIYPCTSATCQPVYTPTATPTFTATPTPTPTVPPTRAATPTFASTAPPGQVGTATSTSAATVTPSPRSTTQIEGNVYLPVVQK